MKKNLMLFIFTVLLLFFISSNTFSLNVKNNVRKVSTSMILEKNNYYIDVSDSSFTTKNVSSKLDNITILKVYPDVALSIQDEKIINKLSNLNFFDMENYINNYVKYLKKFGFYDDAERALVYGIKINCLKIDATKDDINNILLKFPKVKLVKKNKF